MSYNTNENNSNDKINKTFGKKLKSILEDRGMTQAQLADSIWIKPQQVSSYITGRTIPTLENAVLIAKKLGTSLDDLCGICTPNEKDDVTHKDSITYFDFFDLILKLNCFCDIKPANVKYFPDGDIGTIDLNGTMYEERGLDDVDYRLLSPGNNEVIMRFNDPIIVRFFTNQRKMKRLLNDGIIEGDLYYTWVNAELAKLKEKQIIDDLPF